MNLDQLITLNTVVKAGSISEAASLLFKTQPAVSMSLKKLEQDIGFELFDRSGYRLELTDKGKIYHQKSKHILTQMEQLKSLSDSFTKGEEHQVKIAIENTANLSNTLHKLKPVQVHFPNTELIIRGGNMLSSLRFLHDEQVDLAITPWLITFESEGNFESKTIDNFSFLLCGHKELFEPFGVNHGSQITQDMLMKIPQLTPRELAINIDLSAISPQISRSMIKFDDIHCFLAALQAKLGWGPVTDSAWTDEMEQTLYRFNLNNESSSLLGEIRIVKNKKAILGPAAQMIWDMM